MDKKKDQLGMNPSTAAHRLRVDLLFKFVIELGYTCYRCDKELTRETFSIEHKEPWLNSSDPVGKFFDLDNIAFSHKSCNIKAADKSNLRKWNDEKAYCNQCDSWKLLGDFYPMQPCIQQRGSTRPVQNVCKSCSNELRVERRYKTGERIKGRRVGRPSKK